MFSRNLLCDLFRHMEWADAKVWEATSKTDTELDDRLRLLLVHIHVVQRAFLHVWTNQPVRAAFRMPDEFPTLANVRVWAEPYYREAEEFLGDVDEARLALPLQLPWAGQIVEHLGQIPADTTLGDTCFQVTSHSTYHRGQVNGRLRELGAEPPLVDYIAWVWLGKPLAVWEREI